MLNLYHLATNPNKVKGHDIAHEFVPTLAWDKYQLDVEELKKREHLWVQDASCACQYAHSVIRGRWPEGESIIAKDIHYAFWYVQYIVKGRWPEMEQYIINDPGNVCCYAQYIIKGRWPEAEHILIGSMYQLGYEEWFRVKLV